MAKNKDDGRKIIAQNKRARRHYVLGDRLEAGLVLTGTEVKSCRGGKANLSDSYVQVRDGEAWLVGAHIDEYAFGNQLNHEPKRDRKLLLHGREIHNLARQIAERGRTVVALSLYFKNGRIKAELAVATGKTHGDRRDTIRERDVQREMDRALKRRR